MTIQVKQSLSNTYIRDEAKSRQITVSKQIDGIPGTSITQDENLQDTVLDLATMLEDFSNDQRHGQASPAIPSVPSMFGEHSKSRPQCPMPLLYQVHFIFQAIL